MQHSTQVNSICNNIIGNCVKNIGTPNVGFLLNLGGAPGGVGAGPIEGMGKPGAPNHVGSMGRPAWRYRAGDCNCQVCAGNSHIHPNTLCWLHVCKGSEASHAPRSMWPHMFQRLSGLTHSSEIVASSIGDGARVNN